MVDFVHWLETKGIFPTYQRGDLMKKNDICCGGGFPTFALVVLVIGILWLLNDLKIFSFEIPWLPVVLIVVAIGWIIKHNKK